MTEMSLLWIPDYQQTGLTEEDVNSLLREKCGELSKEELNDFYSLFGSEDGGGDSYLYALQEAYDNYLNSSPSIEDFAMSREDEPAVSWGRKQVALRLRSAWQEVLDSCEKTCVEIRGVDYLMTGNVTWGGGVETDVANQIDMLDFVMRNHCFTKNMENALVLSIDAHLPPSALTFDAEDKAYTVVQISPTEVMFVLSRCGLYSDPTLAWAEREAGWPHEMWAVRDYAHRLKCKYIHFRKEGAVINQLLKRCAP